jgi:hypothetical protein
MSCVKTYFPEKITGSKLQDTSSRKDHRLKSLKTYFQEKITGWKPQDISHDMRMEARKQDRSRKGNPMESARRRGYKKDPTR